VLARIRDAQGRELPFGEAASEAVLLTHDEFEDLGGTGKFT
jgi:hypothetical protein